MCLAKALSSQEKMVADNQLSITIINVDNENSRREVRSVDVKIEISWPNKKLCGTGLLYCVQKPLEQK